MKFDNDVFVSYAHIDDQVMADGQIGWISGLHRALEVRLGQLLGKAAKVWRDPKLQGNDLFADRLVESLPQCAVIVSIVSPRYVKSEWCVRELNEFVKASSASGGVRVGDKLRVFKVVKTPIPLDQQPPEMQAMLGYEFYTTEQDSGRQRELGPLASPEAQRLYWTKLDDLANDIADLLVTIESEALGQPAPAAATVNKGTVYLAETSADLKDRRDAIRRELQGNGYVVLPDQPLPLVASECTAFVREQLARCKLSVHMVGRNYGVVPDGATTSLVVLQHELAIERAAGGEFCRLVWMPPDLQATDARQAQFIEHLETDSRVQSNGDLLKTPLEDFKTVLQVRLMPPPPATVKAAAAQLRVAAADGEAAPKRIYLMCDQRDVEHTRPLEDLLFDRHFEVTLPVFGGDEAQVRRDHEESLIACDAAMIYWGAGNDLWLRGKLRELQKIAGYGRTAPLTAKAVYVAGPASPEKQRFRTHDAVVITGDDGVSAAALDPFIALVRQE